MSRIAVAPGSMVRQGQLIGYVGTSGLSTGPHLHYEIYRGGVAVNPMGVQFTVATRGADPGAVAAIKARLRELMGVASGAGRLRTAVAVLISRAVQKSTEQAAKGL